MKNKVLVTGATGLLGSYLVRRLLLDGFEVRAMKRSTSSTLLLEEVEEKIEWIEGDILDIYSLEDAMDGIEKVYHCAAKISHDPRDVDAMMRINVEGTANVVNIAMDQKIEKLLHISSIAAIGRIKDRSVMNETSKWERSKLNSNYAISKFLSEQEVWRGQAEGLTIAIVNPSVILGAGDWNASTVRLFKRVWDGLPFYPKGGTGFVDVRDVARMCIQVMESDISGERFIANGENLSFKSFFTLVAKALGKQPPSFQVTPIIQELAWRYEWIKSRIIGTTPMVTKESARQSSLLNQYENQKSIQQLDFRYTPLEKTIAESAEKLKIAQKQGFKPMVLSF